MRTTIEIPQSGTAQICSNSFQDAIMPSAGMNI